jgi:hypothetical protein
MRVIRFFRGMLGTLGTPVVSNRMEIPQFEETEWGRWGRIQSIPTQGPQVPTTVCETGDASNPNDNRPVPIVPSIPNPKQVRTRD